MLLTGDQCESLLYRAFGRWRDVRLVDDARVHDLRLRRAVASFTLSDALDLARALGSGRLVWGEVAQVGDTIVVDAALYDVARGGGRGRGGATVREHAVRFNRNAADMSARFAELADSLLLGHVRSTEAAGGALGTRVLAAWQAYEGGHAARATWDLVAAERGFRQALELDPVYPHAHLWLAQTLLWAGQPPAEWRAYATAAAATDGLSLRDRTLARALVSLADGQYPQACARYRQLLARDTLHFAAWFGLGECLAKDRLVLRDRRSASGWRFRASYHAAAEAYRRALILVPSVHHAFTGLATERLIHLFPMETNLVRDGDGAPPDTGRFAAFPVLDHDTLAYVPFPIAQVYGGRAEANPPGTAAAVRRNRDILRDITTQWGRAFPTSADAWEVHGLVLETMGEASPALATIRRGRDLARTGVQQRRLAAAEVRLLVKLEDFGRARALADSVLGAGARPGPAEAASLAGLAALTGRARDAAALLRLRAPLDAPSTWDGQPVIAPLQVKETALALLAYAALGAPVDSIRALMRRTGLQVDSWFEPAQRERVRNAVLHVPAQLAFPALGITPVHRQEAGGNYLLEMQWALSRGDTGVVRARFERTRALRAPRSRPGDVAIEFTYGEAWLLLALGDSSAATQLLDLSLEALPTLGTHLLDQVPQAAGLLKAMVLRADLAARAGERATAGRWGAVVATLWAGADPEFGPIVSRMSALAADRNR
jgi:tetratricopeptide (TPR) repeat protein